jgi:processive 1,2-diacylglycerol beta-glucosyltransferase
MTQLSGYKSWRLRRGGRTNRVESFEPMVPDTEPAREKIWRPRVLILSASVGAGHIRAAQAIEVSLRRILPDAFVQHVDVLDFTNAAFRRVYGAGYFYTAHKLPRLVGQLYDMLDHSDRGPSSTARLAFERLNFMRLTRLLTHEKWDLVINTHFLPAELVASLKRKGKVEFPQATVVTDFDVHGLWINQPCEKYFVATEEARENVIAGGVGAEHIEVTGIPIDPIFAARLDVDEIFHRHGLASDRPIVLQLAGGFGVGSIEQIYRAIQEVPMPVQIVVVTGKNVAARETLEAIPSHPRHRMKVLGFTSEMHELMTVASIVVSKPGGLTTSECLARGAAMVVVEPIPGQEDRNSDFLLENGCAIKVNNLASLTHKLASLLGDPARLETMRHQVSRSARPRAAFDVAAGCADLIRGPVELTPLRSPMLESAT